MDADEACYACGWPHGDPGTLVSTGGEVGDVLANLTMVDPCGESVDVWMTDQAFLFHAWNGFTVKVHAGSPNPFKLVVHQEE